MTDAEGRGCLVLFGLTLMCCGLGALYGVEAGCIAAGAFIILAVLLDAAVPEKPK